MFERKEYDSPSWLNPVDRIIFNLIRPVFNLSFSIDGRFPYYPSHFKDEDDIELPGWDEGGDSVFIYELSDGSSEFRIYNINEKYAINTLNPHIFSEIGHLYDISKIIKFEMQSTNVISFVSPHLFQPIKENLDVIEFADCYITEFPRSILKDLHLKQLSFIRCEFGSLSDDFGLHGVGSVGKLIFHENVYANNIEIRPQLKILEKSGTDIVFKSPLDQED